VERVVNKEKNERRTFFFVIETKVREQRRNETKREGKMAISVEQGDPRVVREGEGEAWFREMAWKVHSRGNSTSREVDCSFQWCPFGEKIKGRRKTIRIRSQKSSRVREFETSRLREFESLRV